MWLRITLYESQFDFPNHENHSYICNCWAALNEVNVYSIFRFDAELSEEMISKAWSHRCCYVVKELLVTERIYVQALGEIIGVGVIIKLTVDH